MIKVRMRVYEYYVNQSDGIHIVKLLKRLTKKGICGNLQQALYRF